MPSRGEASRSELVTFVDEARYADAGVDIDAGNRMVDLIKPLVRATARAGAGAEIGGFGGLFDLKAAGFHRPDPGCRDRRRRHQGQDRDRNLPPRHDRHRPGRHVGQRSRRPGRGTAVLPRLFCLRQARSGCRRRCGEGRRGGLPRSRLRPDRRRDRGNARRLSRQRLRPRRICRRRRGPQGPACREATSPRATSWSASRRPACIRTAIRWCAAWRKWRSSPGAIPRRSIRRGAWAKRC